jgi:hypothetical protein
METGMEVGAIPEAHPNMGAHGGVGQQGAPCLSCRLALSQMVMDVALLTCTEHTSASHPLVFVADPLDMHACHHVNVLNQANIGV